MNGLALDSGLIAALAAVSGSFVGSLGSIVGGWINQSRQDHRAQLAKNIAAREALYSGFIAESARLLVDALEHNERSSEGDTAIRPAQPYPAQLFFARPRKG